MATAPSAAAANKVKVEDLGSCRKKLTITIPGSTVTEQLETQMATLAVEAALPGFRPGHVPRRLIEKKFGGAVKLECKNQLIAQAYSQAIQDNKLNVLAEPEGNDELAALEVNPGKDLTFHLEVEVAPEFDLPAMDGLEVKKPLITVKDEQITEQIDRLRTNEGSLETQEKAAPGDYCIGKGTMKDASGKVLLDLDGAVIQVPEKDKGPKGAILGVMVEDFGKQIGLPKGGDELTVKCKGPDVHERVDVRGKDLVITFKVERVERIMPAKLEDILAKLGMADENQMKEQVRNRLEQRAAIEQQAAMRQQVARKLVEMIKMDMPKNVSARQAERNLARARMELAYRGLDAAEVENRIAEMRGGSAEQAVSELKLFFIMNKAAQEFGVQVTEDEVNGRIYQIAMERRVRPDKLRAELIQTNQVGMVVQQVREHKAMDALLARAKVTEIPVEEFNKLAEAGKI